MQQSGLLSTSCALPQPHFCGLFHQVQETLPASLYLPLRMFTQCTNVTKIISCTFSCSPVCYRVAMWPLGWGNGIAYCLLPCGQSQGLAGPLCLTVSKYWLIPLKAAHTPQLQKRKDFKITKILCGYCLQSQPDEEHGVEEVLSSCPPGR